MSAPPDPGPGALIRLVKSEVLVIFGGIATVLCIPLIIWLLSSTVANGNAVTKLDGQIALLTSQMTTLTSQISALTAQLQSAELTRYTQAEAMKDLGYRDKQIDGLQTHLINAENSIINLTARVGKLEPRR